VLGAPLDRSTGLNVAVQTRTPAPGKPEKWEVGFVNNVPLTGAPDALRVNWLSAKVTDHKGKVYTCAWATDIKLTEANAVEVARVGRARWKIENEHNNTLKRRGYHLEHNFGHGKRNLSCILAALNILSFLLHTAQQLEGGLYAQVRARLGSRRRFFAHTAALSEYHLWKSWEAMLAFMLDVSLNGARPLPPIDFE